MKLINERHTERVIEDWPADGVEGVRGCPICGSGRRHLLYTGLTDRVFYCAPGRWNLYQCEKCHSAYLDPRPTLETIGLAYAEYFTHSSQMQDGHDNLSRFRRVRRALANGYRNYRFGANLQPANRLGVLAAMLLPTQRRIIDGEYRHLPKPQPGARLLDVGCGNGTFLCLARLAGWNVVGVDFDPKAVETARNHGLDARQGSIDVLDPGKESFDGITLSHAIEHVHDPIRLLRQCHALLRPGGWIWLETPNIEAQGHQLYGSNWRGLEPPRHLVLFSRTSLLQALEQAGFQTAQDQPYRPLCAGIFAASESIANGGSGWGAMHLSNEGRRAVKAAERKARKDPAVREFITIKAWKQG